MVFRYGDDWRAAFELLRDDPSLAEPAVEGLPVIKAELILARTREMAMTDDDVAVRRTRVTTMDERARLASI
jgi:glycerol-3-phosphate dehydrogenase